MALTMFREKTFSQKFPADFSDFCNPFFYHSFTNDLDFVDKVYAEICGHSLFTLQFSYTLKT